LLQKVPREPACRNRVGKLLQWCGPATEKAPEVSLRLVPRTWKLTPAADRSLLSWQGTYKSLVEHTTYF